MCFITPSLSLHPPLFDNELFLAQWSRRTGSIAGLKTLCTADRIILFLQLVLRRQCDSHVCMNMLQHKGLLSKQTAWQNCTVWWCYILTVPKHKTKQQQQQKRLLHFLGIVLDWNWRLGFSGSGAIIIKCEDGLNVWPSVKAIDKTFQQVFDKIKYETNLPHYFALSLQLTGWLFHWPV